MEVNGKLERNVAGNPTAMAAGGTTVAAFPSKGQALPMGSTEHEIRLAFLDALKATGMVMVVGVHVLSRMNLNQSDHDMLTFLFSTVAVPLFFVADGFLFAHKWTGRPNFHYAEYVRKSAVRLLVPWAVFSVFYAVLRLVLELRGLTQDTILVGNDLGGIIKLLYLSELSQHMYFLLSLFVIRLGSIGLRRVLPWPRLAWLALVVAYIGLYAVSDAKRWFLPGADPLLLACWGLQFYLLGIGLQKWHDMVKPHASEFGMMSLGLALLGWMAAPRSLSFLTQLLYLFGSYSVLLALANRTGWGFAMGKDTMGIYLIHAPVVVWIVAASLTRVFPASHPATACLATVVAVLLSWLMARVMGMTALGSLLLGQPARGIQGPAAFLK